MSLDLPKGHWMHGALDKEKSRLAKKKGAKAAASTKIPTKGGIGAPVPPAQKMAASAGFGGDGIDDPGC